MLPMSAQEYYAIQYQPSFRALFASVSEPSMGHPCQLLYTAGLLDTDHFI